MKRHFQRSCCPIVAVTVTVTVVLRLAVEMAPWIHAELVGEIVVPAAALRLSWPEQTAWQLFCLKP